MMDKILLVCNLYFKTVVYALLCIEILGRLDAWIIHRHHPPGNMVQYIWG